ncbi:hypothetical protein Syun_004272 [Stephania yunnanensis]|uniref:Uncharacterized protein n=1 Tax=Stephania yunnanensis TaxID=152371 RepID=A0AAP0L3N5_9MAGN
MSAHTIDNTGPPIDDHGDGKDHVDPLAIGAGHINLNKAMSPSLIYDANEEDYVRFLCSMNFTRKQITLITRTITNVGKSMLTCIANLTDMGEVKVNVEPNK